VGYRRKLREREQARHLRAQAWTLADIAQELGVAKSTVSLWVRDVTFEPRPRRRARKRAPNALQRRKYAEIDRLMAEGEARIGRLSEREFLVAGTALYAGEGAKSGSRVGFVNTDPRLIAFFCAWLRHFFEIDERRMRVMLYLHEGLDLDEATRYWAGITGVPREQFTRPYRAVPDESRRSAKHEFGCATVRYSCSRTFRAVIGLVSALVGCETVFPG
jgi:transcriptional regulator with XRE-family HTH domain